MRAIVIVIVQKCKRTRSRGSRAGREKERVLQAMLDVMGTVGKWAVVSIREAPSAAVAWMVIYMWPSMAVSISSSWTGFYAALSQGVP